MTIKQRIRVWLGIAELTNEVKGIGHDVDKITYTVDKITYTLKVYKDHISIHNSALARIIAKLDPAYGRDMSSPEVISESREIEKRVMDQLLGDHKASNRY